MRFILALLLAALPGSSFALDLPPAQPSVLYFFSMPLGADSRRDREPVVGFAFQGRHHPVPFRMGAPIRNLLEGGVDAKYLLVGAVAVGAAALAGGKDGSVQRQRAQQQQAEQQTAPPCSSQPGCFALIR